MSLLTPPPPVYPSPLMSRNQSSRPSLFHSDIDLHHPLHASLDYDSGEDTSDISEDDDIASSGSPSRSPLCLKSPRVPCKVIIDNPACSNYTDDKVSFVEHTTDHPLSHSTKASSSSNLARSHTGPPSPASKNIFYIDNTPSPSAKSSNAGPASQKTNESSGLPNPFKRQDSLFSNRQEDSFSLGHSSGPSSSEISEDEDEDEEIPHASPSHERQALSATKLAPSVSVGTSRSRKSTKSDNDSEWVSMSSDDENQESLSSRPLVFSKRIPVPRPATLETADLKRDSLSFKPSPLSRPKSLLSGLFLNTLAMQPFDTKTNSSHDPKPSLHHLTFTPKPVLKRSSTTGVITVDKSSTSLRDRLRPQKPSLLYSKRFASSNDMTKSTAASHVSPVLFIQEENLPIEHETKTKTENLFAKQTSSVGLSDFNVKGNSTSNIRDIGGDRGLSGKSSRTSESTLCTSLNKYYSLSLPSRGFLSKSSLSLSSLFGQSKTVKGKTSWHSLKSNDMLSQTRTEDQDLFSESSGSTNTSSHQALDASPAAPGPHHQKPIKVEHVQTKTFEPPLEISQSLKDSLMIDHKLGRVPMPDRVISDEDLTMGFGKMQLDNDVNDYHSKGW